MHVVYNDLSAPMLELSRATNPECKHLQSDMRTLDLECQFDAVLIHDAYVYMTSETDLQAPNRENSGSFPGLPAVWKQ